MQRQKQAYLSVRRLRQSLPVELLLRPAANSNQPSGRRHITEVAVKVEPSNS
jgi:hypothetical protein